MCREQWRQISCAWDKILLVCDQVVDGRAIVMNAHGWYYAAVCLRPVGECRVPDLELFSSTTTLNSTFSFSKMAGDEGHTSLNPELMPVECRSLFCRDHGALKELGMHRIRIMGTKDFVADILCPLTRVLSLWSHTVSQAHDLHVFPRILLFWLTLMVNQNGGTREEWYKFALLIPRKTGVWASTCSRDVSVTQYDHL